MPCARRAALSPARRSWSIDPAGRRASTSPSTRCGVLRSRHTCPRTARSARKASRRRIPAPLLLLRWSRDEGPLSPRAEPCLARFLRRSVSGAEEARRGAHLAWEGRRRRALRLSSADVRAPSRGVLEPGVRRDLQRSRVRRGLGREYPGGRAKGGGAGGSVRRREPIAPRSEEEVFLARI